MKKHNLMVVRLPCPTLDCVFQDEADMPTDLRKIIARARKSYKKRYGAGLNYVETFKVVKNKVMMLMYIKAAAGNRNKGRFTDGACSGSRKDEKMGINEA